MPSTVLEMDWSDILNAIEGINKDRADSEEREWYLSAFGGWQNAVLQGNKIQFGKYCAAFGLKDLSKKPIKIEGKKTDAKAALARAEQIKQAYLREA